MPIGRRDVLLGLGTLPLSGCLAQTTIHARVENGAIALRPADLAGLSDGQAALTVRAADVPGPVFVRRGADGAFTALLAVCTHQGCELEATPEDYECPCHGSAFDLAGRVLHGPADRPLRSFAVKATPAQVVIVLASEAR
jgi:cytochrome b6-f complex iron-sulfur subunit